MFTHYTTNITCRTLVVLVRQNNIAQLDGAAGDSSDDDDEEEEEDNDDDDEDLDDKEEEENDEAAGREEVNTFRKVSRLTTWIGLYEFDLL